MRHGKRESNETRAISRTAYRHDDDRTCSYSLLRIKMSDSLTKYLDVLIVRPHPCWLISHQCQ